MEKMAQGAKGKNRRVREARDYEEEFKRAMYLTRDERNGIPAHAFRIACIDACRLAGYKMTQAKMSLHIEADDYDYRDGTPLLYLNGEPYQHEAAARNATGVVDIRVRPMWREWSCEVRVNFDADQFGVGDVANLLMRAGAQVGIGEGRPFSKSSAGLGWGMFKVDV